MIDVIVKQLIAKANLSADSLIEKPAEKTSPENINLFKDNSINTRKRCEICSKLTTKIPPSFWCLYC